MVTVSSALWHAGTTPCGHWALHSSHVRPDERVQEKKKKKIKDKRLKEAFSNSDMRS